MSQKRQKWNFRSVGRSQVSHHNSHLRLSGRLRRTSALSRSRSTRLRLARSYDGTYSQRNVGRTSSSCSLDSGQDPAHNHDVWAGGDANPLSEATPSKTAAARLLRDQCLDSPQGTDSSRLRRAHLEKIGEMAGASGRGHPSSAGDSKDDPVATSALVRSKAGANRRNPNSRSSRFSNSCSALQTDRCRKTVCRKIVPTGNRNDVWKMAATTSAHAGDAPSGRW